MHPPACHNGRQRRLLGAFRAIRDGLQKWVAVGKICRMGRLQTDQAPMITVLSEELPRVKKQMILYSKQFGKPLVIRHGVVVLLGRKEAVKCRNTSDHLR